MLRSSCSKWIRIEPWIWASCPDDCDRHSVKRQRREIAAASDDLANLLTLVQQVFAAHGISPVPPVIPVGGGRSTFLLNLPGTSANFSDALSLVRNGRKVLLRVQDTKPATFLSAAVPRYIVATFHELGGTTVAGAIPSTVFPRTDFTVGQVPVALAAQDLTTIIKRTSQL